MQGDAARTISAAIRRFLGGVTLSIVCAVALTLLAVSQSFGQAVPEKAGEKAAATPSGPQVTIPEPEAILALTRGALLTLNDALQTGNFTVLRDVGARSFRDTNSAARLSQLFAGLAAQRANLSGVATVTPKYSAAPALDQNGLLRLTGAFPLPSAQIDFNLLFQYEAGRWRLFGISVQPNLSAAPAARANTPKTDGPAATKPEAPKPK